MAVVEALTQATSPGVPAGRRAAPSERWGRLALLAPSIVLLLGVFLVPLGIMLWRAFTDPHPGLDNLTWYVGDRVQRQVLFRTFTTAFKVTVVCLLLGYPYAYAMVAAGPKLRAALTLLVLVPFWTSLMVRSFAWVILLQDRGPVQHLLTALGLGHPQLIRTNLGVIIGMSQILLPFLVMPLYAVMSTIDRRLILASSSLGAHPLTSFVRVWLPLSLPGVGAGSLMVFISSLGFYVTPALLGSPRDSLISQQLYTQVNVLLQWGRGGAMGAVLLVVTFAILAVLMLSIRQSARRHTKASEATSIEATSIEATSIEGAAR
ncbi:ABC transporter permease [Planosporangium thailandense]|uniref:ABC transporter permease n=1 Tax=Planosporangium thailandense TaxID=765197 RepID=A0ABX0Y9M1_9ACTN|nr:ABC transporter permease [Planosporangium thailandense]NJC73939.1 ABC transporter permease [Planosporangium thailandense]